MQNVEKQSYQMIACVNILRTGDLKGGLKVVTTQILV
ncbi:MAG: hypothetical protein J07HQX50_02425 [Haloquadratum sp. J07HQX50]|nr:MAG: hypothetical protein J07HQX50_02425 [Haloquadratum sp. J07HQX50]